MSKRIVCACEDVTLEDIEAAVRQGFGELETCKRYLGFGTGPCQGKECLVACIEHLARVCGATARSLRLPTIRQPIVPLTMEQLASRGIDPGRRGNREGRREGERPGSPAARGPAEETPA